MHHAVWGAPSRWSTLILTYRDSTRVLSSRLLTSRHAALQRFTSRTSRATMSYSRWLATCTASTSTALQSSVLSRRPRTSFTRTCVWVSELLVIFRLPKSSVAGWTVATTTFETMTKNTLDWQDFQHPLNLQQSSLLERLVYLLALHQELTQDTANTTLDESACQLIAVWHMPPGSTGTLWSTC